MNRAILDCRRHESTTSGTVGWGARRGRGTRRPAPAGAGGERA